MATPPPIDFAALEEQVRQEAELKVGALRTVHDTYHSLINAREEFLSRDREQVDKLNEALKNAKSAGFTESDLRDWKTGKLVEENPGRKASSPSGRKTRKSPATRKDETPIEPTTLTAVSG